MTSALLRTGRRIAAAHRRQTALWELRLALPPEDGALCWVDTVDEPRLHGFAMPAKSRATDSSGDPTSV